MVRPRTASSRVWMCRPGGDASSQWSPTIARPFSSATRRISRRAAGPISVTAGANVNGAISIPS
jgi:hypothetical protein